MTCCKVLGVSTALWLAATTPAFAYIDPGTGSILAQALIGAVVAAGVLWRSWWSRLTGLFRRGKGGEAMPGADPDASRR